MQVGQEADEETQNWLDNMMSNTVVAKTPSGAGGDLVSSLGALRAPKPKPGDRAMRKTLIMRTGTSEVRQHLSHLRMPIKGSLLVVNAVVLSVMVQHVASAELERLMCHDLQGGPFECFLILAQG